MNYITHLNKAFAIFCEDERLTPFHVSLYYSLFQYWNMARFRNPISISRDELMRASKIGSVNTYIRCIKELDKWAYIKYMPSYNPQKGSQVYLYDFNNSNDNSNNNGTDISNNKGTDKASKKAIDNASEKQVRPSINNSNSLNSLNNINSLNLEELSQKNNLLNFNSNENSKSDTNQIDQKKEKSSAKKEKVSIEHVKNHFAENNWPAMEAEKFYNHYESNGWLIGGRSPMKNWQASASNWMLNEHKFNNGKTTKAGKLNATIDKNYGEPL